MAIISGYMQVNFGCSLTRPLERIYMRMPRIVQNNKVTKEKCRLSLTLEDYDTKIRYYDPTKDIVFALLSSASIVILF